MGFTCPERKGVADFLQEVTSKKDQKQYWIHKDQPYRFVTAKEFAEAFQSFHVRVQVGNTHGNPFEKSKNHPAALTTEKYGVNKKELLKALTAREILLIKRNAFVYVFRIFQISSMAIIFMTVFLRTELSHDNIIDVGLYMGALFFAVMMILLNGMAELPVVIGKLPVFYKQMDLLFYPSWSYALPTWFVKIPVSVLEVAFWVILNYYVIGFDLNVGRFVKHYVVLFFMSQVASSLFRATGAVGRNMVLANTYGGFVFLVMLVLGGFTLARGHTYTNTSGYCHLNIGSIQGG